MEEKKDWVEEIGNIELEISYTSGVYDLAFLMGYGWYEEVEKIVEQIKQESREEGYQKGWEDGSKGKVFEKIEVETEVTFKDLRDVIEGKEDAGEFLSKLTTK